MASRRTWLHGALVLLAVFTYFHGLDSQHIPKNGDEYPYEHITRLTAESGRLLPLRSDLVEVRNTKPPFLFWQGILSTRWGRDWTLWNLRYPSVLYTLATGLMVFLLAARASRQAEIGLLAALHFLAFFSTYRFGRPFLTNPPEVFWLSLPFFALACRPAAFASRVLVPTLLGLAVGVGLLYKSFALAVPVGLALAWWHLRSHSYDLREFLRNDAVKVVLTMVVSLAIFGSWFLLDPDPRSVWRDFVLHENVAKFDAGGGYLSKLLWGTSSLWSLALAFPLNAGLLVFPVAVLLVSAYRRRRELSDVEKLLWIWALTLFLVYSVPSQRSGRYLLPAMPAVAVLLALAGHRVSRKAFVGSLVAAAGALGTIAVLSIGFERSVLGVRFPLSHWLLLVIGGFVVAAGLVLPDLTRVSASAASVLSFLSLAFLLRPLDGPLGRYDEKVRQYVAGKDVWVPYDFVAKFEGHRFLLPGARIHGYRDDPPSAPADLLARYPLVVLRLPVGESPCEGCKVLGNRLDIAGRQSAKQLREILIEGDARRLLANEVLVEPEGSPR